MRYKLANPQMFVAHRERLKKLMLRNALAIVHANDLLPTNADGMLPFKQNSDLFYLTGVDQEETVLVLFPDAQDEKMREILFLRETSPAIARWEGAKLDIASARKLTGIENVKWLGEFPRIFHQLMCECERVYLNTNEHKRALIEVETRDARFIRECQARYPLHEYHRLARLMHPLRVLKSDGEVELIRKACSVTEAGFRRVLGFVRPGVNEMEVEAEFAHEFIRQGAAFAYTPIIASGKNNCVLHYVANDQICRKGELLLMDVAASYANYNSDLTRTVPVSGRFSRRQRQVYESVLRVLRGSMELMRPGKRLKEIQKAAEEMIQEELLKLGLLKPSEIKKQNPDQPAFKRYFMHGVAHPLGLDVHDVGFTSEPLEAGWVLTCEPAIYIDSEGFGIRLENDVLVTESGNVDLMAGIPIEPGEIEQLMSRSRR